MFYSDWNIHIHGITRIDDLDSNTYHANLITIVIYDKKIHFPFEKVVLK